jgi:hypothetical protein
LNPEGGWFQIFFLIAIINAAYSIESGFRVGEAWLG